MTIDCTTNINAFSLFFFQFSDFTPPFLSLSLTYKMNVDILINNSTFWRVCDSLGNCHCDFRYTIHECQETTIIRAFYITTAAVSSVLGIVNAVLLYFNLYHRNQKIFVMRNGFPRPKPIESMGLFGVLFNLCKLLIQETYIYWSLWD